MINENEEDSEIEIEAEKYFVMSLHCGDLKCVSVGLALTLALITFLLWVSYKFFGKQNLYEVVVLCGEVSGVLFIIGILLGLVASILMLIYFRLEKSEEKIEG